MMKKKQGRRGRAFRPHYNQKRYWNNQNYKIADKNFFKKDKSIFHDSQVIAQCEKKEQLELTVSSDDTKGDSDSPISDTIPSQGDVKVDELKEMNVGRSENVMCYWLMEHKFKSVAQSIPLPDFLNP